MSPVAINGVDKQGVDINGVQVKQSLNPANSTVNKGVYNATLLETVDADLAVGNIKQAVTIFGKLGTLPAGGVETIEKYADATLAAGATYTPAASGIFFNVATNYFDVEYYSNVGVEWCRVGGSSTSTMRGSMAIGDGTNYRIMNNGGVDREYCLMRQNYSLATYERAKDEELAGTASWTPANSGFFADAEETTIVVGTVGIEINKTTAGWTMSYEVTAATHPIALVIGDGTNLRVHNISGTAYHHVTMRAKLT